MRAHFMLGLLLAFALGCGSQGFAPVSGRVTLNGKPLAHAMVSFNRVPKEGSIEAGPSSLGKTNQNGEFTLKASPDQPGALVGRHRVAITVINLQMGESDAPRPRGSASPIATIPSRYNDKTELFCDVPPGGTNQANFDLTSP